MMVDTASLLFNCKDRVGVIAVLANFFSSRELNISRYEEYVDDGHFFSRLEWKLDERWKEPEDFCVEFAEIAASYDADVDVHFFNEPQNVGLFASKQTHALIEVLNKHEARFFPNTNLCFIIGNDKSIQKIADRHGIPFFFIDTDCAIEEYETKQLEIIERYQPNYIGLARYMKVLSADFLEQASCPVINIHHSFLPSFVGAKPYQMAYDRGVKLIGATSHFVTPDLDQGPIIEQDVLRVGTAVNVKDMVKMGRDIEQKVFARALLKVLEHKAIIYKNRTIIFN